MNIPKASAKLSEIVGFYFLSPAYRRLSATSQKDYESQLKAVLDTVVEGKRLGDYRCKNIKVRHLTQAYDQWLNVGVRTANYRKSVLSAAWENAMR